MMTRLLLTLSCGLLLVGISLAQTTEPLQLPDDLDCEELESGTDGLAFYVGQGAVFYDLGSFTQAIELYNCALSQDAAYLPALVARGFAYAAQGRDDLALDDYNRVLSVDETNIPAYLNRGVLYTTQGRFSLALSDFNIVIALDPNNATAYNNRAVVNAAEANLEFALEDVQIALEIDPDFSEAYITQGMIYSAFALDSYQSFRDIEGQAARLPIGDPDRAIEGLAVDTRVGAFGVWLPLLQPAN